MKLCFVVFTLCFFASSTFAKCNFLTGNYIDELSHPGSILSIDIEVKKSAKYFKNAFSTILSRSKNIPPKLKKRFKASLTVAYHFGSCKYAATIRQNGDWKDHIRFIDGGKIARSLDVKLIDGNIANAVRFKLLLPETRNGAHEVLASLILREANFISPETFEVNTTVNGISSVMLFQENASKELLERRLKREGPIFEGDESLLWSYENYKPFELEGLALTRMENVSWFKKGNSSQQISIEAHSNLQGSYLKYAISPEFQKGAIFPNQLKNQLFIDYNYLLMAMNGSHALTPHNQKFYFNAIETLFEPIYYDGNIRFDKFLKWTESSKHLFPKAPTADFMDWLSSPALDVLLLEEFSQRVLMSRIDANEFVLKSLKQFRKNQRILQEKISAVGVQNVKTLESKDLVQAYKKIQDSKGIDQVIITKLDIGDEAFSIHSLQGDQFNLTINEMADLLEKNTINSKRFINLAQIKPKRNNRSRSLGSDRFLGNITFSDGINVDLDIERKTINFVQSSPNDWVLISDGNFSDWKIIFKGTPELNNLTESPTQRFNNFGLTGCLTIYKSTIDRTKINVEAGGCEDSVNIINSKGTDLSIFVSKAYADAVDFDFSNIGIKVLEVQSAGNDCFDVSGGTYTIDAAHLKKCTDKAISVGEKSVFDAKDISISESMTALAVKDFSVLRVSNFLAKDVLFCGQAYQKKQEFGGAILNVQTSDCSGSFDLDINSTYVSD